MNTCIFATHTTLDLKHAEYSLKALLYLQTNTIVWDIFNSSVEKYIKSTFGEHVQILVPEPYGYNLSVILNV